MDRREFLGLSACAGGAMLTGCRGLLGPAERVPYGGTIGDRLWMWGHHRDSFTESNVKGDYGLPNGPRIEMAAACREMDIPGCFVVRWLDLPKAADVPDYMRQFAGTRRVGFSITDSAKGTFDEKVALGFACADRMPNLSHFVMDDYWCGNGRYKQPLAKIEKVKASLEDRGMKLAVVLYSDQNGLKDEYREITDLCDEVTFWFWHGKNTGEIEARVARLHEIAGDDKPVLLGQYMWDFGAKKPMSGLVMEKQLEQTSRLLASRAVSGVIFHCTPLVDMNLDAVRVSREWIRENAGKAWGTR